MSSAYSPLVPAIAAHDEQGVPRSHAYGDRYHPQAGALVQAHEVFLKGNGLPGRWGARDAFTICETGFGLGLNFLASWQAWREDPARSRRLHFVSIEAHPFSRGDLQALLRRHAPAPLDGLAAQLLAQWPPLLPGLHRLEFESGQVTLTLALGWAERLAPQLSARVDAYFLDGFAPDRNPAMWSPALLGQLARLAAPDATLATWCSAGAVRRALEAAGFEVQRLPGSHGKRHITVGRRRPGHAGASHAADRSSACGPRHALVIGGGPAGAGVAHALSLRGWRVTVLDGALAGAGQGVHAGHLAAACTPLVARDDNVRARLSRAGSRRALARWQGLGGDAAPWPCGTVQLARDEGRAADLAETLAVLRFPSDWVRPVTREAASALAGLPVRRAGIFFAEGMLLRPKALLAALLGSPGVERIGACVAALRHGTGGWQAMDADGRVLATAPVAVLANAAGAPAMLAEATGRAQDWPALAAAHRLAGEVTYLPAGALDGGPRCIIGGEGYLLPASDGWCVAGSTYVREAGQASVTAPGQRINLGKAAGLVDIALPGASPGESRDGGGECGADTGQAPVWPGWSGWRAVLPGRLPAIGPVAGAEGLWLACGYASRGFSWSALAGEIIAAALEGEPAPLERDLQGAIAPR